MSEIKIIEGEISNDFRSETSSLNSFRFDKIKRMYTICHPDKSIIRGWHGHQFEKKCFISLKEFLSQPLLNWMAGIIPQMIYNQSFSH